MLSMCQANISDHPDRRLCNHHFFIFFFYSTFTRVEKERIKKTQKLSTTTCHSKHGMFHAPTISSIFQALKAFWPVLMLYSQIHVKYHASKINSRIFEVLAKVSFSLVHGMRTLQTKRSKIYSTKYIKGIYADNLFGSFLIEDVENFN